MVKPKARLRARLRRKGIGKWIKEVIQGWFPSKNAKFKNGVEITRTIDREEDKYNQVVRDAETGKITHKHRESLHKHRKSKKRY